MVTVLGRHSPVEVYHPKTLNIKIHYRLHPSVQTQPVRQTPGRDEESSGNTTSNAKHQGEKDFFKESQMPEGVSYEASFVGGIIMQVDGEHGWDLESTDGDSRKSAITVGKSFARTQDKCDQTGRDLQTCEGRRKRKYRLIERTQTYNRTANPCGRDRKSSSGTMRHTRVHCGRAR
ncbi:hypothetical protein BDZ89DRAFT_1201328 [Hymenopellis radicata]|nr:hypothetical protein BDZ89DRAFT_1201328 [Hymenopellis radicata]